MRMASATLFDNGNLVLQELYPDGSVNRVLWQSFDYPTDTLLPGMKLGINLKTGHRWSLTSWRSKYQPASGSFTLTGDPNGTGQFVIFRRGEIYWKSGFWQNGGFGNTDLQNSGPDVRLYYISNETEQYFTYLTKTYNSEPAVRMYIGGQLKASTLNLEVICRSMSDAGCAEYEFGESNCRKDDYFHREYENIGVGYEYDESYNLSSNDCQRICWSNCSCVGYSYASANRGGCKTYSQWIYSQGGPTGFDQNREDFVIMHREGYHGEKTWIWLIVGIGSLAPLVSCCIIYKKFHIRGKAKKILKLLLHQLRSLHDYVRRDKKMNTELHYFTFQSISSATNNFSTTNKLGEWGFGAVYKGKLVDGQEVAVKRLSKGSSQGVKEFKNETELIAKLQHTNLVRLIGCCIEKKEKILVYEYMPNNSLDFFLFDSRKQALQDWNNRFVIIEGIAQGLLYLHKFSRLRAIHRDLKASNILLDDYLKPKISDFGMAKLFEINESKANTSRVVGTR